MAKAKTRKGREVGPETLAVRAIFDKHGPLTYTEALPHLRKAGKSIHAYFTEEKKNKHGDMTNAGANRYNVAKNAWKKAKGVKTKARKKSTASTAAQPPKKRSTSTTAPKKRTTTRRASKANDFVSAWSEVKGMGGIAKVEAEIERLQALVATVNEELQAVA